MYTVLLPPGGNPIAVNKIYRTYTEHNSNIQQCHFNVLDPGIYNSFTYQTEPIPFPKRDASTFISNTG